MRFTITTDFAGLNKVFSEANVKLARGNLTREVLADTDPFVPYDTGTLSDGPKLGDTDVGEGTITWTQPYAAIVYNMDPARIHQRVKGHPLATSHWVEHAAKLHGGKWAKDAARFVFGEYLR
jgi:hypothetical protein